MSMYGSQRALNTMGRRAGSRGELNAYARGSNGFTQEFVEGYGFSRGSMSAGQVPSMTPVQQQIMFLQTQCQDYLDKAALILKSGGDANAFIEAQSCLASAAEITDQLRGYAMDLNQQNLSSESVVRSVSIFSDQIRELSLALNGPPPQQKWSSRSMRRSVSREEHSRFFTEAMSWILQQRRLIETSLWGDDLTAIEQQIANHSAFHSSIQRSGEVDRARAELLRSKDQNAELTKSCLNKLDQEWDSLLKVSYQRSVQLQDLRSIIEEISAQIMWVNDREEEELVFDWGDKNIDAYIPQKQESFSKLMSELEQKEVQLNVLKTKVDGLLRNKHPASDKIQAYMETLQTQWSWLLQITKCINVHLKENARYSQFFKETSEMNSKLQKEHDSIRKSFSCDKSTALHNLLELLHV
ncbi:desmoplakin [Puntigrus tetrazona]|uniref:desmoplakin n=1 Tax=Puntigrus tetrazona TaxID=1606681 RepID=UPI001C8A7F2C|nr:desmoplakin [Puntigrus tetrazona]